MDDNSFVPVIPDIKDHSIAPSAFMPEPPPQAPSQAPPQPPVQDACVSQATSWWDWSTWPLALKIALGTLVVVVVCLMAYAGYVWFTERQKKKEEVVFHLNQMS